MGDQNVKLDQAASEQRSFVRHVIRDLHALEMMLDNDMIESDRTRIGAEQEFFLVDDAWRPASVASEVLAACRDIDLTPELARFNVELNVQPMDFEGGCLRELEASLLEGCRRVRVAAQESGADALITGILPTLVTSDLTLENMVDSPRYRRLDATLRQLRGGDYLFRIKGTDELIIRHDSLMIEACNTSLQVHLQVAPADFAAVYNVAQIIAAPVTAASTNSPLLFGQRLWRETRLALFQQSMDTRQAVNHQRETSPRVNFGTHWLEGSVVDIFKEDIARFRVLLGTEVDEDPFEVLAAGGAPSLVALRLHNGTVYRWNRPCYGISGGRPHLRIENRLLPAGPTVVDEVANAALWLGLLAAGPAAFADIPRRLDFDDARGNLLAAARHGLAAHFDWLDGEPLSAPDLILERLVPLARGGLAARGIASEDIDRYLGVIEERVASGLTGSQWQLSSLAGLRKLGTRTECLAALTAGMARRQRENEPVHTWDLAQAEESGEWRRHYQRVEQYMTTELFTVNQEEAVDLVACLMDWRHIRHVPVEDNDHRLVGLVSHRVLLRLVARGWTQGGAEPVPVKEIMETDLVVAAPETSTLDAIELMREHQVACLPVVREGRLVGIVTERDLVRVAAPLLERALRG